MGRTGALNRRVALHERQTIRWGGGAGLFGAAADTTPLYAHALRLAVHVGAGFCAASQLVGAQEGSPSRQLHAQAPRVAAPPFWGEVLTQACSVAAFTGKDVHLQFYILYGREYLTSKATRMR